MNKEGHGSLFHGLLKDFLGNKILGNEGSYANPSDTFHNVFSFLITAVPRGVPQELQEQQRILG